MLCWVGASNVVWAEESGDKHETGDISGLSRFNAYSISGILHSIRSKGHARAVKLIINNEEGEMQESTLHRRQAYTGVKLPQPIRLLIADDQRIFTLGLRKIFTALPDIYLLGVTSDGHDIIEQALQFRADVVLVGMSLDGQDGIVVTKLLKQYAPGTKVIVMASVLSPMIQLQILQAGADYCCEKRVSPEHIVSIVRRLHGGDLDASAELTSGDFLTPREAEILLLVAEGLSNKQIGRTLDIAVSTVKNHLTAIYNKLGVQSRTQAVMFALSWGRGRATERNSLSV